MLTINSRSPLEMISGFNLTVTRREKRQGMKLCSVLRTICNSTWLDESRVWKCARKLDPTAGSLCLQFLRHATWMTLLSVVISMLFTGESNYVFPQLPLRCKRIEIIFKIKANCCKEIAHFTILVAIVGNKISKYFYIFIQYILLAFLLNFYTTNIQDR